MLERTRTYYVNRKTAIKLIVTNCEVAEEVAERYTDEELEEELRHLGGFGYRFELTDCY